jgi:hypothetical protein
LAGGCEGPETPDILSCMELDVTWRRDLSPAAWVPARLGAPARNVGSFVPPGFEAYVRIFHPLDIGGRPRRWAEIASENGRVAHAGMQFHMISRPTRSGPPPPPRRRELGPSEGSLPIAERRALVGVIRNHAPVPGVCWFCVWEGFGGLDFGNVDERIEVHGRSYALYGGPLEMALSPLPRTARVASHGAQPGQTADGLPPPGMALDQSPNMWWPDDRSWFVATDVDLAWTYVGGPRELARGILDEPSLEAFPASVEDVPSYESDTANAALD